MQTSDSVERLETMETGKNQGVRLNFVWERISPYKWVIVIVVLFFEACAILYSMFVPHVYEVKTVLLPKRVDTLSTLDWQHKHGAPVPENTLEAWFLEQSNLHEWGRDSKATVMFRSRTFTEDFIKNNHMIPILLQKSGNNQLRSNGQGSTLLRAYRIFDRDVRRVTEDLGSGHVVLAIRWHDRAQAVDWSRKLVDAVNLEMRAQDIGHAKSTIANLQETLNTESDPNSRKILEAMLSVELSHYVLAKSRDDYGFFVLSPPEFPDNGDYIWPRKGLLALVALVAGMIVGVMLAFTLGLFRPIKES